MANKIEQFRKWLRSKRHFRTAWFAKDPQMKPAPEEALSQLPEDISESLMVEVNELPTHSQIKETVIKAVKAAMDKWKENPHASENSIVILGNPISSVSRIMSDALNLLQDEQEDVLPVRMLNWVDRPADVQTIQQQVKDKLGLDADSKEHDPEKGDDQGQGLMIIPNLCWCFLRSADGLDGLDYLQDLLPRDRNQFWIMGSGVVGWEYLSSTLKFHAYCGSTVHLPSLSAEDLQDWLLPIIEKFKIQFPETALHKRLQNPNGLMDLDLDTENPVETLAEIGQEVSATVQSSVRVLKDTVKKTVQEEESADEAESPQLDYFHRLADISEGNSIVALQLFIKSLRYKDYNPDPEPPKQSAEDTCQGHGQNHGQERSQVANGHEPLEDSKQLVATVPKLPPLPELSQSDMYLLYSLMLHGDMTVKALAKSLGDAPQVVNNQVQMLRKKGVIEQREKVLKTNPAHYPRLRKELSRNNFIITLD